MAEFKLSLIQRKNLKTNEEKLNENLQIINDATGQSGWAIDIDWGLVFPVYELGDRPGDTIYDSCMTALAENIKKLCENDAAKESFLASAGEHKIVFNVNKKAESYWSENFVNGTVEIGYKRSPCNVYELGSSLKDKLTSTFEECEMPLKMRIGIEKEETQEKKNEQLEKIKDATGRDFTITVQWAEMIKDHFTSYPENFGSTILNSVLEGLADNIKKVCTDEHFPGKDAFNEFATTGNIIINSNKNDKKASSYFAVKFENGDLVVSFKSICNCYEIGSNIRDLLTVEFEEVTMPYVTRRSLAEYEEKKQEYMEIINTATGRTFELQIVWPKILPFMLKDNGNPSYIGSTLYDSVMGGLSESLKNLCADEMSQEAFNDSASTGKIVLTTEENKKASGYFTEKFENGDVVIAFTRICNCYEIGRGFEKLL